MGNIGDVDLIGNHSDVYDQHPPTFEDNELFIDKTQVLRNTLVYVDCQYQYSYNIILTLCKVTRFGVLLLIAKINKIYIFL